MTEDIVATQPRDLSEEQQLIQAARQDPRAFGKLYKLYVSRVFRYLYSRLGNQQEAEDVTAQTFLTAFESFERFRGGHFAAWLFTIARNKATDHFRRQKPSIPLEPEHTPSDKIDPLSQVIQSEQNTRLAGLIRQLTEKEQQLLQLRYLAEMTYAEMGDFLHRSEQAVKKATYRLLARLQSQLEETND